MLGPAYRGTQVHQAVQMDPHECHHWVEKRLHPLVRHPPWSWWLGFCTLPACSRQWYVVPLQQIAARERLKNKVYNCSADRMHMQNMEQLHWYDCHQNVSKPQAKQYHKKYTHIVHRNYESGLAIILYKACCTQTGPAGAAGCGDSMDRWQHSSHLRQIAVWLPLLL